MELCDPFQLSLAAGPGCQLLDSRGERAPAAGRPTFRRDPVTTRIASKPLLASQSDGWVDSARPMRG